MTILEFIGFEEGVTAARNRLAQKREKPGETGHEPEKHRVENSNATDDHSNYYMTHCHFYPSSIRAASISS